MNFRMFFRRVKTKLILILNTPFEVILFIKKRYQKKLFMEGQKKFLMNISILTKSDLGKFIDPHWEKLNRKFFEIIKNGLPFNFLRHSLIGYTMFVRRGGEVMRIEKELLKKSFPNSLLKEVLLEEYIGLPIIFDHEFYTSHNSIRLLYHIARWQEATGQFISDMNNIIEWGGGYGRMAVLIERLKHGQLLTYVIVDTPLFSSIQWIYLSTVLGKEKINLLDNVDSKIVWGRINLVPLNFVDNLDIRADLFLSTWALSESSLFSIKYVIKKNLYSARHVLIGYQDKSLVLPESEEVKEIADSFGCKTENIPFLPKNHYIFS